MSLKKRIAIYQKYNNERKAKAAQFNPGKAALLFKIIPFLLHSNYPDLPGYVDDDKCPYGLHSFDPEEAIDHELFRRYFPNTTALRIDTPSPYAEEPCIHSLMTIGSIGSIAQSDKSDCDYWLSIRHKELGEDGVRQLEEKCKNISDWAQKKGTEVYFFLMDIDQTKENSFESAAEEESAGSAIKILLKDELFRTHILVAGKMVLWWLIPPGLTEKEYQKYVLDLVKNNKIKPDDFIDLGYLSDIPKSEIFGACLWQMNKALDSPFKSVIKFAYLELLLRRKTEALPLFSDKVKCFVTYPEKLKGQGEEPLELSDVDPYLLLARDIVAYYQNESSKQKQRDSLIRECLFLKTLEGMESQKKAKFGQQNYQKATMKIMEQWNLLPDDYDHFVEFKDWKYKELVNFGIKVHDYLIETYKSLRWIFKNFSEGNALTITERDVSILGRKLFTFYEKKPNKIDYIRSVSRDLMGQKDITIHITKFEGKFYYYAFQGEHDHESVKHQLGSVIKREDDLVRLITWLLVNGILHDKTSLHLTKNFLPIDLVDIQQLAEALLKAFPIINFSQISAQNLIKQEAIVRALIVVNFSKEPVKGSKTFKSTLITENSYGEYFIQNFTTLTQIKNAMRSLLTKHYISRWNNNLEMFIPNQDEISTIKTMLNS